MKINLLMLFAVSAITLSTSAIFAGVPETAMLCKSTSGNFSLSGHPYGENFDITIKSDKSVIHYTNVCDGSECSANENYGKLIVVDALYDKVFTIAFENNENNDRGMFYALPNTVQYKKNSHGYTAKYKGIYLGDDPSSTTPYKEFVKFPGIELICTQENML